MFNKRTSATAHVAKVSYSSDLVFDFVVTCKVDGEEHFDAEGDHIPEDVMLKAAADLLQNNRGGIIFAWPMTAEIAKAFGMTTSKTGLMVAMKASEWGPVSLKSGGYTFKTSGLRLVDEDVTRSTTMVSRGRDADTGETRKMSSFRKAEGDLDTLAKEHAAKHGMDYFKAYEAVLLSPTGRTLYTKSLEEQEQRVLGFAKQRALELS